MVEKNILDKISESDKLTKYEKLCAFYLVEIHIDNIEKIIKRNKKMIKKNE